MIGVLKPLRCNAVVILYGDEVLLSDAVIGEPWYGDSLSKDWSMEV